MKLYDFRINRTDRTVGIDPEDIMFSFKAERGNAFLLSLYDYKGEKIWASEITLKDRLCFRPDFNFQSDSLYTAVLTGADGDSASITFRTAGKLSGKTITAADGIESPVFYKKFRINGSKSGARLIISGLGLYRAFINGKRVGNEYLTPLMNDYDGFVRYQTYMIQDILEEENLIEIYLGNGWFKGRFGIDGRGDCIYGDKFYLNAVIKTDGGEEIKTDESWFCRESTIRENGIYDGEKRDDTVSGKKSFSAVVSEKKFNFVPEYTAGVKVYKEEKGELIISPKGEKIIDFGTNESGFVRFVNRLPRGKKIILRYGEVLQDGCFYRENLRTAKAEYVYVSDGSQKIIEPYFTYYGFRYVLIETDEDISSEDFTAVRISSEMKQTMEFISSHNKLNRLIENVKRGQRSNFMDVPTDCPQRDERLGWTADTQVFASTASYNAETYSFYKKFMRDMSYDSNKYYGGDFPMYSPSLKGTCGAGGAVWSDAGVIVPWTLYVFFADKKLLRTHYEGIKRYIEVLRKGDKERGDKHILSAPFTFGDWLAQDGICPQSMRGGTDDSFIRSVYYFNAAKIAATAARALGEESDKNNYSHLSEEIKESILKEYFSLSGRLAVDTQTAYVLALHFGIYRDKDKVIKGLKERLKKDLYRLKTGFTGTPFLCDTLFGCGMAEDAYRIIFNEQCPGWMYQINLGATTVWERWNSLLPDGKISGTVMNSLNHYAYGSVAETIYRRVGGLSCSEPGWGKAKIAPVPDYRVTSCSTVYDSPSGLYSVKWKVTEGNIFTLEVTVPHGCEAEITLPYSDRDSFTVGEGNNVWRYVLNKDILHPFSIDSLAVDIISDERTNAAFRKFLPQAYYMATGENKEFLIMSIKEMGYLPMFGTTPENIIKLDETLKSIGGYDERSDF